MKTHNLSLMMKKYRKYFNFRFLFAHIRLSAKCEYSIFYSKTIIGQAVRTQMHVIYDHYISKVYALLRKGNISRYHLLSLGILQTRFLIVSKDFLFPSSSLKSKTKVCINVCSGITVVSSPIICKRKASFCIY